jgi:hypothetical protein
MLNGGNCLKFVGVQQSEEWDQPRAGRTGWRRTDTVWIQQRSGVAARVERVVEFRPPARTEVTQKNILRYDLESTLQYPGQLSEDRRREINQARLFAESAQPMLGQPSRFAPQLKALLGRVEQFVEQQPPTPYREAVLQVKRRVEAANRGELPTPTPPAAPETPSTPTTTVRLHEPAPEFYAKDLVTKQSLSLRQWKGRPVLMVFYAPTSDVAEDLLHFAQALQDRNPPLVVVSCAVGGDVEKIRKQRAEWKLAFPVLDGAGLRISYDVDWTPRVVLLDGAGVVRGIYVGWGEDARGEIRDDVKRWQNSQEPPRR